MKRPWMDWIRPERGWTLSSESEKGCTSPRSSQAAQSLWMVNTVKEFERSGLYNTIEHTMASLLK